MDDARFVGGLHAGGDLDRQFQRFVQGHRAPVEPVGEGLALDVFQNQVLGPVLFLDAVDAGQVDVAQRSERLRLALEALQAGGVLGEVLGQLLDRHVAVQPRVAGQVGGRASTLRVRLVWSRLSDSVIVPTYSSMRRSSGPMTMSQIVLRESTSSPEWVSGVLVPYFSMLTSLF